MTKGEAKLCKTCGQIVRPWCDNCHGEVFLDYAGVVALITDLRMESPRNTWATQLEERLPLLLKANGVTL